jgi:predicted nuclease of predicted toxin-antitoxin system
VKIKLDENMPRRVEALLRVRGHDVDTVHDEGRAGQLDAEVALAATHAGRMLVTLDRGFPAPATLPRDHPGVIVLKLRDQSAPAVEAALAHLLDHHDLEELRTCIVIVAPGRIRIRRPT